MTVYMADRDLPGITLEQLAAAQKAAIETEVDPMLCTAKWLN